MANASPGFYSHVSPQIEPPTDDEVEELRAMMSERFKAWTGKELVMAKDQT